MFYGGVVEVDLWPSIYHNLTGSLPVFISLSLSLSYMYLSLTCVCHCLCPCPRAAGIREPDVMTRVTEYVPEIVSFVQGIIARGYAYEAAGAAHKQADRQTDRQPPLPSYLSLYLHVSVSVSLSISLSVCVCVCVSDYLTVWLYDCDCVAV